MNKAVRALFMFSIIMPILCGIHVNEAQAYTPKTVSKLVADVDGRNPSAIGRIPLILIHGVHGTDSTTFSTINGATPGEKGYFQNFINYFYNSDLKDKYQLYRFHYLSDQLPVKDIGKGLKEWLDDFIQKKAIPDGKYIIVAHSMGGLVARSYMQEQQHAVGNYKNQNGGERIEKLITLATPHHGSPGANGASRNALMTDAVLWQGVVELASIFYNSKYSFAAAISDTVVNRSDLRADNYGFDNGTVTINDNSWLTALNQDAGYDSKIKSYYGSIDLSDTERILVYNEIMASSPLYLLTYAQAGGNHQKLIVANIIMNEGLNAHFPFNDGMVPEDSANFAGHAVGSTVKMTNYDHEQMKDGRNLLPNELFDLLKSDLETNYTSNNTGTIVSAEYFVDTDPGIGNGKAIPPKDSSFDTTTEDVEFTPDTSSLTIGVHNLYVRMKSSNALWGTPRKIPFEVTGNKNISASEYFIDTDPGEGQGTPLVALDGAFNQAIEDVGVTIDTSAMSAGLHTLSVRAENSEGHWGTPRAYKFEVLQPPVMASAEYYVDTDPGVGNGTAMNAEDGSFNSNVEALLKTFTTSSLGIGTHTLYVRAKDTYQRWGVPQSTTFLNMYILSVARNGNGTGSVTSGDTPQGINCGSDCTEIYNGQSVTLTAVADPGSTFISFAGCTTVSDNTCTVLMTADKSVSALFNDITPPDTFIGSKPNTLTNSASASFTFTSSEANSTFECRLDNSIFAACTSPKNYTVPLGLHTFQVRATDSAGNTDLTPDSYTWERKALLTLGFAGDGRGTVTSNPIGIASNTYGTFLFTGNTSVTLKAKEDQFCLFKGWSGDCTGFTDCLLTMNADKAITVTFDKDTAHQVRLDGTTQTFYSSILNAMSDAATGDTIKAWGTGFTESINLNKNNALLFKGGYDDIGYTSNNGMTVITGTLTITNGSLKVQKLILRNGM